MPYPPELLNSHEKIVVDNHPHWLYFLEPALGAIAALFLLAVFGFKTNGGVRIGLRHPAAARHPRARGLGAGPADQLALRRVRRDDGPGDLPLRRLRQARHRDPAGPGQQRELQPGDPRADGGGGRPHDRVRRRGRAVPLHRRPRAAADPAHHPRADRAVPAAAAGDGDQRPDRRLRARPPTPPRRRRPGPASVADEIAKLETLYQKGTITQAQFEAQKQKLLGG